MGSWGFWDRLGRGTPARVQAVSTEGSPSELNVLIITAEPDERLSTRRLQVLHEAMSVRPDVRCELWFLRDYHGQRWPNTRNVDSLRTWWLNRLLTSVGLGRVASFARGRRLKHWMAIIDPDVAILDDGFGSRLLSAAPRPPAVVVRTNEVAGDDFGFEDPPVVVDDAAVNSSKGGEARRPGAHRFHPFGDYPGELEFGRGVRERGRGDLPVDEGVPLVVGWGDDGWVDGSDLFVRTLWFLEHRQGIVAHGIWLGPQSDEIEAVRVTAEAQLCGLGGRVHLLADDPEVRYVGDVALLPRRVPLELAVVPRAGASQVPIVTFAPVSAVAPWLFGVPYLDLPAAARAVASALAIPHGAERDRWLGEIDLVEDLVSLVSPGHA